ncbi:MAG TPA: hypothetical protein PLY87_31495 [Planctomycetaceae bacterium]|nr:hypothetical protein [Planctomycetaceae bacterium]
MTAAETTNITPIHDFEQLAAARRGWIDQVLRTWCQQAALKELRKAELEWFDIAGRADVNPTLWTWAWERFPAIVHPDLPGVHETHPVEVMLRDNSTLTGYPDARQSLRGMLVLVEMDATGTMLTHGPISIDEIVAVREVVYTSHGEK